MQFLSDLDGLTVVMTGVGAALIVVFLGLLWRSYGGRWPKDNARILGALLAVAMINFVHAYTAYCPDADQPHITLTGPITPYKSYTYTVSSGRHSSTRRGLLVCVGACSGDVPLMEFDAQIMGSLAHRNLSRGLKVIYLGRKEEADLGNGYAVTAHPAVEVDDGATGEQIYYKDTRRHWPRVIVLVAGALICLSTMVFCLMRVGPGSDQEDGSDAQENGSDAQEDGSDSIGNDLTGLGLEGGGHNKA